jgi:hypothetical protein
MHHEAGSIGPVQTEPVAADIVCLAQSKRYDPSPCVRFHPGHVRVIAVEYGNSRFLQSPNDFRFFAPGYLKCAERPVVFTADRHNYRDIGQNHARILGHLPSAVNADFNDGMPL